MTLAEIAAELGISITTAFRDEQRALEKLREVLGDAASVRYALLIAFADDDQIARKNSALVPHDEIHAERVAIHRPTTSLVSFSSEQRARQLLPQRFPRKKP